MRLEIYINDAEIKNKAVGEIKDFEYQSRHGVSLSDFIRRKIRARISMHLGMRVDDIKNLDVSSAVEELAVEIEREIVNIVMERI